MKDNKIRIIKFDEPNTNGRVYKKENFKEIKNPIFVTEFPSESGTINIDNVIGTTVAEVEEDGLYVKDFKVTKGKTLENSLKLIKEHPDKFAIRTSGFGNVDKKGNITDYKLKGVFFTDNPA